MPDPRSAAPRARSVRAVAVAAGLVAVQACLVASQPAAGAAPPPAPRVVILGFDGLAADRVESLIEAGRLPTFAKLKAGGGYARLRPSNPAQSPVSWASITTGWNPGKTGITDFLRRKDLDPTQLRIGLADRVETEPISSWMRVALLVAAGVLGAVAGGAVVFAFRARRPSPARGKPMEIGLTCGAAVFACAAFVVLRWVPDAVPSAVNLRSGEPFWKTLDRAGVRAVALDGPLCFPPEEMDHGGCLAGLGVPDMAGTWGSFSVWSDDVKLPAETETAGRGFYVPSPDGRFELVVGGPPNALLGEDSKSAIRAEVRRSAQRRELSTDWTLDRRRRSETEEALLELGLQLTARLGVEVRRGEGATVTLQDGTAVELTPGRWSDLLPVEFVANPVVRPAGRVRLLLEDAGGPAPGPGRPPRPFRLFLGQVQWDLARVPPNVALTSPRAFAAELAAASGPVETIGWPEMTNPVKDGLLSDQAFVDHTYLLLGLREKRLYERLGKGDWDCLFAMFSEPDRVQHALYRHVDPECPTHDPEAAGRFAGEIDRIYAEADRIVARTIELAGPETTVLVVSDHGFAPFRRGVNLNNLFCAKGLQTRSGAGHAAAVQEIGGEMFGNVVWESTDAYAAGLGNVYVNLQGREPRGSVPPTEYEAALERVTSALEELRDADGKKVVRRVYRGKDLYHGARVRETPDLVVGFEWGYRVSWQCCLGALDADVITPNTQSWSGDHCSVDPELVPAVLFSTRPLAAGADPKVEDVAPTTLALFGVAPPDPDGRSVLAR